MSTIQIALRRKNGSGSDTYYLRADYNELVNKPTTFTPVPHPHKASEITSETFSVDRIPTLPQSKITDLATALGNKISLNAVMMPTNPFGGAKLYINSIDNAMYAMDKKAIVTVTRHLISYGGETYPKLNPSYVAEYTVTGSGTVWNVTGSPLEVVVYNNDTRCSLVTTPTTQYQYTYFSGVITLGASATGTIRAYPDVTTPQYLDSPVESTVSTEVKNLFNGSYENSVSVGVGKYLKIRVQATASGYGEIRNLFGTYQYGTHYLSYYYTDTPNAAELRVYNFAYRPHTPGWKKYTFADFAGVKTGASYIQSYYDGGDHGASVYEYIVYNNSSASIITKVTQIDLKLDRPDLSMSGATVTKFGTNKIYYDMDWVSDGRPKIGGVELVKTDDSRLTNARPASDVSEWAKAATKPGYTQDEVADTATYVKVTPVEKTTWSGKEPAITKGNVSQYFRGDMSLATFPTIPTVPSYLPIEVVTVAPTAPWTGGGYKAYVGTEPATKYSGYFYYCT